MLPRAAYVDPGVFAWEQKHFFGGGWTCVGRSSQTPAAGDMRAEPAGEGSVLIVRGDDGVLRAFANFCRHRGHELLPCGAVAQAGVIICPYHSWTYGLAGNLRAAAGFKNRPGFDAEAWDSSNSRWRSGTGWFRCGIWNSRRAGRIPRNPG